MPRYSAKKVAHRLVRQANLARGTLQFELAAALYEEALVILPGNARIHVQCGHMLKEARQFDRAEYHYEQALRLDPSNPDLAMQLGHFYKVAGRIDEARLSYERALALRPGWLDAIEEVDRTGGIVGGGSDQMGHETLLPELLPRGAVIEQVHASAFRLLRFGHRRRLGEGRGMKELCGIEAVRGYRITNIPLSAIQIMIDGQLVRSEPLHAIDLPGMRSNQRKYVFNLWHDFSEVPRGQHEIVLRLMAGPIAERVQRDQVFIEAPGSQDFLDSDAYIPPKPVECASLEDHINALPSVIRSTKRSILPSPIRTILVQRVDQLGDFACSVPAIHELHKLFPGAKLVALVTNANAELAQSIGLFDDVIIAEFHDTPNERRRTMTESSQSALKQRLAVHTFDIAIDLGEGAESRPLLLLSGARFLYGFKEREAPWLSAGFEMSARDPLNGLETMPPANKILAMVTALAALKVESDPFSLPIAREETILTRFGINAEDRYIVLHAGARLTYSQWPHFVDLMRLLLQHTRHKIVLFSDGPAGLLDPRVTVIPGILPFEGFDALLANADVFVGNDSGPKHLAALRGTKVVSLHMARLNWSEWGQTGDGLIISRRVPCAGCALHHHPEECGKAFACLTEIKPEEVLRTVLDLLEDLATPQT